MNLGPLRCWLRPILLCVALWALALPSLAAGADGGPYVPPVPLLWKVSGNHAQLYLLGSFHLLKADDYPPSGDVQQAFEAADRLVFELSSQEADSVQLGARMQRAARRTDGSTLRDDLDEASWHKLETYARQNGISLPALKGLKLWSVGLNLSIAGMRDQGMQADTGLDRYFMDLAAQRGKPVEGLEPAAAQIALLDGMSLEEQRQLLAESLDSAGDGEQVRRLHQAWRRGDAQTLWTDMAQDMRRHYPALYRSINIERNDRWVPLLERYLRGRGTTLVIVGALHLLGSDGVVEKLRARGYRVERICSACISTN